MQKRGLLVRPPGAKSSYSGFYIGPIWFKVVPEAHRALNAAGGRALRPSVLPLLAGQIARSPAAISHDEY